jgi:serine/threonine-protein kinase
MSEALKDKPITQFNIPSEGLNEIQVCKDSGKLPTFWCPPENLEFRLFVKGEIPTKYCDIHNKITVPDVRGLNSEEGKKLLADMFFSVNEIIEINNEYEENIIFKTDPLPGTIMESHDNLNPVITIFISQGSEKIIMPDLTGQTKNSAENMLKDLGLSISDIVVDYNSTQPIDLIYSQNPAPGSTVAKESVITVYVSKGANPSQIVPDTIGLSKENAIKKLNDAGFLNISIIEEENKSAIGFVFKQSPAAQTSYNKEQAVVITISKGIKVPDVMGMKLSDAINLISSLGFIAEIRNGDDTQAKVVYQSPAGSTFAEFGSKVILDIKDDKETTTTGTQSESTTSTTSATSSSESSTTSSTSADISGID